MPTDWQAWHEDYDDPGSSLSERRAAVQRAIRARLDTPGGPTRVLSLCAGDGADLLGVLTPGDDVAGRLVELDRVLAERARATAPPGIEVLVADAGSTDAAAGAAPADLLLLCGIFGNIADSDIRQLVDALPVLCAAGATVVWTRGRHGVGRGPLDPGFEPGVDPAGDLTPAIRRWFTAGGCRELSWEAPVDRHWSVGAYRFDGRPQPCVPGRRLFSFVR